ncbi:hypothetical protein [uncultured Mitsuokella sp.]
MAGIAMATAAAGSLWQDKTSLAETAMLLQHRRRQRAATIM